LSPVLLILGTACLLSDHAPATTADAKNFAPASFLPKKNHHHHRRLMKTVDDQTQASATTAISSRGGSKLDDATVKLAEARRQFRIMLSYGADVVFTLTMTVLLYFWVKSMNAQNAEPASYPYFAQSVLEDGFCNKDFHKAGTKYLTQKICSVTDWVMVGLSYVVAKARGKDKSKTFLASAAFTVFHGIVHYWVGIDTELTSGPVKGGGMAILAVIMGFIPVLATYVMNFAPSTKDSKLKIPIALGAWAGSVFIFKEILKMKQYSLTYINVTLFLAFFGSRALLLRPTTPENKEAREKLDKEVVYINFYPGLVTAAIVIFITFSEPMFCDGWFGDAGGHLLFEIALYAFLMQSALFKE